MVKLWLVSATIFGFLSVALGAFGAHSLKNFLDTSFSLAGWGFFTGILLFSGSLYLLAITGLKWLGVITPIGGVAFLLGWICFSFSIIKAHI